MEYPPRIVDEDGILAKITEGKTTCTTVHNTLWLEPTLGFQEVQVQISIYQGLFRNLNLRLLEPRWFEYFIVLGWVISILRCRNKFTCFK